MSSLASLDQIQIRKEIDIGKCLVRRARDKNLLFKMYQLSSYQDLGVKGVTNPNVKVALSGFKVHSVIFSSESTDLHI